MLDISTIENLKKHLSKYGLYAQKNFGQNFLIDASILDQIVAAGELQQNDYVVEVGPGPGALSQRLAPVCGKLTAVEIDEKMIAPWMNLMQECSSAEILHQDVLTYTPPDHSYKLIANIPYYITSPILKHFLRSAHNRPDCIVLMIQKEVAQRICSKKKPTLLSWEIGVFGEPEIICSVPPESFYPSPKVDSAVLKIAVFDTPKIHSDDLEDFFSLLSKAYHQPRKTLQNNLQTAGYNKDELSLISENSGISFGLRPHQLQLDQWIRLLKTISSKDS